MFAPDQRQGLRNAFFGDLSSARIVSEVEAVRRAHTGKASPLKIAMKALRNLPPQERPSAAAGLNALLATFTSELKSALARAKAQEMAKDLAREWQDLSLPGIAGQRGGRNPVTQVEERCLEVLRRLGFQLVEGPEVETAYYTFEALNIPEHHPARDLQDTFWLEHGLLLRTHTTAIQARYLEQRPPLPIRIASSGRVYRNEAADATHLAMFHQLEGLWVDRGLTFAHLKGILGFIARELFGERPLRFKPKYYPYTEPSAGVDLQCDSCAGLGCGACHGAGWITILGCGMVHPKVFLEFGFDPKNVAGIAFGLGTTRMASQWAGVGSVRSLYSTDVRVMQAIHRGRP